MSFPTLHITQGGIQNGDLDWIDKAPTRKRPATINWVIPKCAQVGDDVVIHFGGIGLCATATVISQPVRREDWNNKYGAKIGNVALIDPAIPVAVLLEELPELTWARYPRGLNTPTAPVADKLRDLIDRRRREGIQPVSERLLPFVGLYKLRATALAKSTDIADVGRAEADYRRRANAIRYYALARSEGFCEACDLPAPFVDKDGRPFLEVHHLTSLADEGPDHPENVAALCPNCHRRAHSSKDSAKFSATLAKAIAKIEAVIASDITRA